MGTIFLESMLRTMLVLLTILGAFIAGGYLDPPDD